jgi:hypothetical protein
MMISEKTIKNTMRALGAQEKNRDAVAIEQCVRVVAARWIESDGTEADFHAFCLKHYVGAPIAKTQLLQKIQEKIEKIFGLSLSLYWSNAWSVMMQTGPLEPIDNIFSEMDPNAHILEDFYRSKLALVILLNFPLLSLDEKRKLTTTVVDRARLAQCRLAELCQYRILFEVRALESSAVSQTFQYLGHLMFDLDRVVTNEGRPWVHNPIKVDCHWGLRDQIVLHYQDPDGLSKQTLLAKMWERAILEEVPSVYYDDATAHWDPVANVILKGNSSESQPGGAFFTGHYARLRGLFEAKKSEDAYSPETPNYIARSCNQQREISESSTRELLMNFLTNPLLSRCAEYLKKRLKRPLQAFDIVYNQFGLAENISVGQYDDIVAQRFTTLSHFKAAIPDLLIKLGFEPQLSQDIASKINVVACRTGGFASFPKMRGGEYILATSMEREQMHYMSFATAMHELGHCVERYLSSESIDHYILGEVPSSAFTEAFAFLFDSKSLDLLGVEEEGEEKRQGKILNLFWTAFLSSGIALVELDCWQWMYNHPGFTEAELKSAVIHISRTIWNRYFSPILGETDSVILAGYSPMLINPIYMPEYALAIFIQTQIDHYLEGKTLGVEMPRMCKMGRVTPDEWMMAAVGQPISSQMLLRLTESVLVGLEIGRST